MMFTVVCVCLLFWCVLLLQARTGAVRDGWRVARAGRYATESLYPDHDAFWLGLLPGVPAVLAFLCSGRRQFLPRFWRALRWLLILAQVVLWSGSPCSGCTASRFRVSGLRWWWRILSRCCGWSRIPVYAPVLRKSQIKTALLPILHSTSVDLLRKDVSMKSLRLLLCALRWR